MKALWSPTSAASNSHRFARSLRPIPESSRENFTAAESPLITLPILYQDEWFVAVSKPSGMFVHRTDRDRRERIVLMQSVRQQLRRPVFAIHRLDRPASGIVLFGLSSAAAAAAAAMFRTRKIEKTYRVLVRGHIGDHVLVDRPLRQPDALDSTPRPASTTFAANTRYEIPLCSDRFPTTRCSLATATPHTGRFHQVRRHLNGLDHPVIGDTSHGDSRQNHFFRTHYGVHRLMLHAASLSFQHPFTGEVVRFNCPIPDDYSTVLQLLSPHIVTLQ